MNWHLITVLALVLAPTVSTQDPPASRPRPQVFADYLARRTALFQEAFVADYRSRRRSGEPVDAPGEAFLRQLVQRVFDRALREDLQLRRLQWLARAAMHRSDEDPLVLFAAGQLAWAARDLELARGLLRRSCEELATRSTSTAIQHFAQLQLLDLLETLRAPADELDLVRRRCHELLAAAIADPLYAGPNQRVFVDLARQTFDGEIPDWAGPVVEKMERTKGAHPWALATVRGKFHIAAAWAARGSGLADTVSEKGWQRFRDHLEKAQELLAAACALDPSQPYSATDMITVAGGLGLGEEEMETWFDRAVAAELDCEPAYRQFLHFLLPRWGGSHEQIIGHARGWAAGSQYDTVVPDVYRQALSFIAGDFDDPATVFRPLEVQRTLRAIHAGYLAQPLSWARRLTELSEHVVVLTLGQRARDAAAIYQTMDGPFDDGVLARYGVKKGWLTAALDPHLTPHLPKRIAPTLGLAGWSTTPYDPVHEPLAIDHGPRARTGKDLQAGWEEWTRTTFLAAYDRHGHKDPRWDGKVREVVAGYPQYALGTSPGSDLPGLAAATLAAGCEDPLVRYVAARVRLRDNRADEALPLLEQAIQGFSARGYPELFLFYARRQLESVQRTRGRKAEADALLAQVAEHAAAMASDPCFAGDAVRYYVDTVVPERDLGWRAGPMTATAIDKLAAHAAVDPWIRQTMVGLYHAAQASGSVPTVLPAASRAQYFSHVRSAAEALQTAWALRPGLPQPAVAMIVVAGLEPDRLTPRAWFERAVALQFDLRTAYNNFLWMLRPDWGGSIPAMYRFGVECLQTRRFDTDVPLMFQTVAEAVAGMLESPRCLWAVPEVAAHFGALADGVNAARPGTPLAAQLAAGRYLTAWAGGRYEAALAGWEAAGRVVDASWLTPWKTSREAVTAELEYLAAHKPGR